ncbi:unnamed protein product [Darwinula stevensoni]|uniref:START domain-containing protein n=1 Tax=Darwinula stevensoni TaxID=69355 RepID=A0A7R8XKV1_9CRUS|nr:unnamed protein product [Darwinula stevensoni]CAG0893536.1 unnamed protein product [Darwinula stevensoni]
MLSKGKVMRLLSVLYRVQGQKRRRSFRGELCYQKNAVTTASASPGRTKKHTPGYTNAQPTPLRMKSVGRNRRGIRRLVPERRRSSPQIGATKTGAGRITDDYQRRHIEGRRHADGFGFESRRAIDSTPGRPEPELLRPSRMRDTWRRHVAPLVFRRLSRPCLFAECDREGRRTLLLKEMIDVATIPDLRCESCHHFSLPFDSLRVLLTICNVTSPTLLYFEFLVIRRHGSRYGFSPETVALRGAGTRNLSRFRVFHLLISEYRRWTLLLKETIDVATIPDLRCFQPPLRVLLTICNVRPMEQKYQAEGERALEKFLSNLERKDWKLEKDFGREDIVVKSAYDHEKKMHFILTEAQLNFDCDWVFADMQDHTFEATASWYSEVKEMRVVQIARPQAQLARQASRPQAQLARQASRPQAQLDCMLVHGPRGSPLARPQPPACRLTDLDRTGERLTETSRIMHYVTEPKLGGLLVSRDVVYLSHCRRVGEAWHVSTSSTVCLGMEEKGKMVRAELAKGSGLSFSPHPEHNTDRTLLRWVTSMSMKIPLVPSPILLKLYVEASQHYVFSLRKYLSSRWQLSH